MGRRRLARPALARSRGLRAARRHVQPEGTFAGVEKKLDHLAELGITAIELMPIADFPGKRGWGYDGVLQFAPESAYGRPEELKSLIAAAHRRGIAVMLDVVYNHFGPEGNYLHLYAPQFFTDKHHTPWGAAINFDSAGITQRTRLLHPQHAVLARGVSLRRPALRRGPRHHRRQRAEHHDRDRPRGTQRPGRERELFLVLENGANHARFLGPPGATDTFDAQWNDDVHHCLHTLLTGETDGYYEDYVENPYAMLCRCLAEGFGYQGQTPLTSGLRAASPADICRRPPS
jgi:maltooligosyltrehalose trehalohydrolase